jgi:hypothetical protein
VVVSHVRALSGTFCALGVAFSTRGRTIDTNQDFGGEPALASADERFCSGSGSGGSAQTVGLDGDGWTLLARFLAIHRSLSNLGGKMELLILAALLVVTLSARDRNWRFVAKCFEAGECKCQQE